MSRRREFGHEVRQAMARKEAVTMPSFASLTTIFQAGELQLFDLGSGDPIEVVKAHDGAIWVCLSI